MQPNSKPLSNSLSILYVYTYDIFKYFYYVYIRMKVKFTTTIDEDLLKKAKKRAIDENKDLNAIIENLFKKWLKF